MNSRNPPSPYAVYCRVHGKQYLTEQQYDEQLSAPDSLWVCPICGGMSDWDDDNFDSYYNTEE